jgi:hypothetical protein
MILANSENLGPAKARNQAVRVAKGDVIAFLDNDAKPDPGWLKKALQVLEHPDVGVVQCKLLLDGRDMVIDSIGSYLGSMGFLVQRVPLGQVRDAGQFEVPDEIFTTKSAGMLVKKNVFTRIGGFDPDYFIYEEEMDLCWRVWLHGYKVLLAPQSIVYHKSGSTKVIAPKISDELLYFHGTKNYILTVFKNGSIRMSFIHSVFWLGVAFAMFMMRKPKKGFYVTKGIAWNLTNIRQLVRKRASIQFTKKQEIPDNITKHVSIAYYLHILRRF